MATTYTRIQTGNSDLNRVQDSVNTAVQQINTGPFVGGNLLSQIAVPSGLTQSVPHNLGYTPTVVFTGVPNANATVWSPQLPDDKFVYLKASTNCVVNVWVK